MTRYPQRIGWMLFAFGVQALYFPVNWSVQPTLLLKTPLDALVPLWPAWVLPYVLTWVMWLGCATWAVWKMEPRLYKAAVAALLATACVGLACFLVFPNYTERLLVTGDDRPAQLLRGIQGMTHAANAFPSAHVYITTLIALFWVRWYPRHRAAWIAIVAVVSCSTIFTHEHHLLDVVGGLALGWAGFHFGLAITQRLDRGGVAAISLRGL